jgi:hypothetical protein
MPAIDQQPAALKARQFSTNEQARPLAIFAGTQRLGSTYLGDPWNYNYSTVGLKNGKYVFATWALMHCRGPVDKIYKIIWDNEEVYNGLEYHARGGRAAADSAAFRGYQRLAWVAADLFWHGHAAGGSGIESRRRCIRRIGIAVTRFSSRRALA